MKFWFECRDCGHVFSRKNIRQPKHLKAWTCPRWRRHDNPDPYLPDRTRLMELGEAWSKQNA